MSKTSYKLRNSAFLPPFSRTHLGFTKLILENGVEPCLAGFYKVFEVSHMEMMLIHYFLVELSKLDNRVVHV